MHKYVRGWERAGSNCGPRTVVAVVRTPNAAPRRVTKTARSVMGTASGQRGKRSSIISRWVNPCHLGSGPVACACSRRDFFEICNVD